MWLDEVNEVGEFNTDNWRMAQNSGDVHFAGELEGYYMPPNMPQSLRELLARTIQSLRTMPKRMPQPEIMQQNRSNKEIRMQQNREAGYRHRLKRMTMAWDLLQLLQDTYVVAKFRSDALEGKSKKIIHLQKERLQLLRENRKLRGLEPDPELERKYDAIVKDSVAELSIMSEKLIPKRDPNLPPLEDEYGKEQDWSDEQNGKPPKRRKLNIRRANGPEKAVTPLNPSGRKRPLKTESDSGEEWVPSRWRNRKQTG